MVSQSPSLTIALPGEGEYHLLAYLMYDYQPPKKQNESDLR